MSGARRQQPASQSGAGSSILKTAATFAIGAVAGAAIAYFASNEEPQRRTNQPHIQAGARPPRTQSVSTNDTDTEKEEKIIDGVVKVCEICFIEFEELKAQDVQIMATPCGHVFCRICIMESLNVKPECPNCRQHVEVIQLQRLYL